MTGLNSNKLPGSFPAAVWAVGGGKGGIGKSFISSSLAICLARMGKSVTLVDLDLGSANLHTCLGVKIPQATLSDFITGKITNLEEVAAPTEIPGLSLISGFNDSLDIADTSFEARQNLIKCVHDLPSQFVVLDLGAGTSESTLDFFLAADQKIVAVTPEPTSIENAYRFLKSSFYRRLRAAETELGIQNQIEAAMDPRNRHGIRSPADLMNYLMQNDPKLGLRLHSKLNSFNPQFLLNQVRTKQDIELGHSIRSVYRKYFGVDAGFLGYVDHDNAVWQSLRKRRAAIIEFPYSSVSGQFFAVTKNLLNPHSLRAVI